MLVSVTPAFAEAELEYRRRQIEAAFVKRQQHVSPARRSRLAGLLRWGRRPNPAPPVAASPSAQQGSSAALRPSPHHAVSRG